jgi:hypothetical protein
VRCALEAEAHKRAPSFISMVISKSVNRFCSRIYLEFIQQIWPLCASKTGSLKERSARPFETRPAECARSSPRTRERQNLHFKESKKCERERVHAPPPRTPGEFCASKSDYAQSSMNSYSQEETSSLCARKYATKTSVFWQSCG